jgi:multimeric flavodoxin WrbA
LDKYLLISGSPRKGNTDFVLSSIFDSIEGDKELILLRNKDIKHCTGCLHCHDKPECVIKDDMGEILSKMLAADVMIIGSPNYFGNVTGLMKDFIDRTHPHYKTKVLKGKKVFLIMVGGSEIERSKDFLDKTTEGLVKYQKLELVGSFCFKALQSDELAKDPDSRKQIAEIVEKIKSV